MRGARRYSRGVWMGSVLCFLTTLLGRVEDGQFEREYSRLYTGLVGIIALILLVVVSAVVGGLMRRLMKGARHA
jgi:hypothetical protein